MKAAFLLIYLVEMLEAFSNIIGLRRIMSKTIRNTLRNNETKVEKTMWPENEATKDSGI
jgi:hypothetical protein